MEEALAVLRSEFGSEPGSFMLRLYTNLEWDRAAFSRLERAMRVVCMGYVSRDLLDRWLAEGFYYVSIWVPAHTAHPDFSRPQPESYYAACLTRLHDLADWFFHGWNIYQEPPQWEDL